MNSIIRLFDRRAGYFAAAFAILLATIVPALAFAAQVTERSIELSSSSVSAPNVTYKVNFKSVDAAQALVIDFCSDTPLYGEDCAVPAGFNVGALTAVPAGFTAISEIDSDSDSDTHNTLRITGTVAADTAISAVITGITNPSASGALYARVTTFDTEAHADDYVSNPVEPATNVGMVDNGSIALYITPTVGVSGAVLETMTFCVSGAAIAENCALTPDSPPTLKLGEPVGDIVALNAQDISTGNIYTQISTNAGTGAVISLKSGTACGGMKRAEATICDIVPALQTDIIAGQSKFGVITATATDTGLNANGTLQPVPLSGYNNTTYAMNYLANNSSGVTSTFGDPFLNTNGAPANNKNMTLTFGASISNNTPAGLYTTNLSMIATGKF